MAKQQASSRHPELTSYGLARLLVKAGHKAMAEEWREIVDDWDAMPSGYMVASWCTGSLYGERTIMVVFKCDSGTTPAQRSTRSRNAIKLAETILRDAGCPVRAFNALCATEAGWMPPSLAVNPCFADGTNTASSFRSLRIPLIDLGETELRRRAQLKCMPQPTPASQDLQVKLRNRFRKYLSRHHPELDPERRPLLRCVEWKPSTEMGSVAVDISFVRLNTRKSAGLLPEIVREFLTEEVAFHGYLVFDERNGRFYVRKTSPKGQVSLSEDAMADEAVGQEGSDQDVKRIR